MTTAIVESIRRRPLVWFFALAYAICALCFYSNLLIPLRAYSPLWLVGIFSPTIAGLAVTGALGGWPEVKRLLSGYARWRFGWPWYLAAASLGLFPLVIAFIYIALGNPPAGPAAGLTAWRYLGLLGLTLVSGPLAEETGWRGFALPRLEARYGALNSSLLLGLLWAFWHVPQYSVAGVTMIPFPIFVPLCLALGVLFTWVYNNTRGSLVATTLVHFSFNFAGGHIAGHLGLMPPMLLNIIAGVGLLAMAAVVAIAVGPKTLSRKPLGELPFQPAPARTDQAPQPRRPSPAQP